MTLLTSLRLQALCVGLLSLTLAGSFGLLTINSYFKYQNFNHELNMSYHLEQQAKELKLKSYNKTHYDQLMQKAKTLKPDFRKESFEKVLAAYQDKQTWIIPKRTKAFIESEQQFRNTRVTGVTPYLEKRIKYYGTIAFFSMLLGLLGMTVFMLIKVFGPLKDLKKKMVDFLNDRYSYQFTVPAPNEVGQLHATFNAMAQRVQHNMEDLKSLDKAKSEFLSIASHELRTPLTSIKGSLSLLNSGVVGKFDEAALNLVTIAEGESDRLIRLINDLLDLAKIEARKLPLEKNWHPFKDLVDQTVKSMEGLCQAADVKIEVEDYDAVKANFDKDRIQQVLTNLLSNAIKYSPKKKKVTLKISINDEDQLLIEVQDQGKGIAPEDQELIFEQFRQVTGPNKPIVKGTGLGLAIAKALVDEHKGEIGVKSWPKRGSTFFFTLPEWEYETEEEKETSDQELSA